MDKNCTEPAVMAVSSGLHGPTQRACASHLLEAMQAIADRDSIGVFWASCPEHGTCEFPARAVCGVARA